MRTCIHTGETVPATLGEYRDLCHALAPGSAAVAYLDEKIATSEAQLNEKIDAKPGEGRDLLVIADDVSMRTLLMPLLAQSADEWRLEQSKRGARGG